MVFKSEQGSIDSKDLFTLFRPEAYSVSVSGGGEMKLTYSQILSLAGAAGPKMGILYPAKKGGWGASVGNGDLASCFALCLLGPVLLGQV